MKWRQRIDLGSNVNSPSVAGRPIAQGAKKVLLVSTLLLLCLGLSFAFMGSEVTASESFDAPRCKGGAKGIRPGNGGGCCTGSDTCLSVQDTAY